MCSLCMIGYAVVNPLSLLPVDKRNIFQDISTLTKTTLNDHTNRSSFLKPAYPIELILSQSGSRGYI